MAHEELTALTPTLAAIPSENVLVPSMPISTFLGESEQLRDAAVEDEGRLRRAGLAEDQFVAFPTSILALRSAEVLWQGARFGTSGVPLRWKNESPGAWKLRAFLISDFRHFFRKSPELLRQIDVIAEGSTNDDMLLNLIQLAEMGENNRALLENTDFDLSLLATARRIGTELTAIYAGKRVEDNEACPEYDLRNRAYTYCKAIVDDIRENGKHIHPAGDPRADLYVSAFNKKKNQGAIKTRKSASTPDSNPSN